MGYGELVRYGRHTRPSRVFEQIIRSMNERYSRQILFREIGKNGQQKLLDSRVLIVGCGALGASHAEMLARAGVGKLRIVDRKSTRLNSSHVSESRMPS